MSGQTGNTDQKFWSLELFQNTHNGIPINQISGRVAINGAIPVCTESVVCATHRHPLVPDLQTSLTATKPELIRKCPTPDCQTTATVGPFIYTRTARVRESLYRQKKAAADSHLQIYGSAHKTHTR